MRCSCPVVGAFDCSPSPFFATAKLAIFFEIRKHFYLRKRLLLPYSELFRIIPNYLRFFLHISSIFRTFASSNNY